MNIVLPNEGKQAPEEEIFEGSCPRAGNIGLAINAKIRFDSLCKRHRNPPHV